MSWLSRVVNVARRARVERDLDDEIRFHLEARIEEFTNAGMTPADARMRALRQFGNAAVLRESSRDVKLLPWLESLLRDVGFGLRLCHRHKMLTAAIVSLSLAIGACTASFSILEALVLRPLPVADPDSLVYAALRSPADDRDGLSFNFPLFRQMREAGSAHVSLFAVSDQDRRDATFDDSLQPEKVYGQWISGDAFGILGLTPALGCWTRRTM